MSELPPRAQLQGLLYFNATAYQRARLILLDKETEESSGFSISF